MLNFPERYVERVKQLLPESELDLFFEKVTEPLPKAVRCKDAENIKKIDGWKLAPTAIPEGFFIDRDDRDSLALGKTLPHFTGQIYVQSLSSMLPVDVLDPQPGEKILDLCAAPGSKTSFIAQRMGNSGCIVANEISGSRSKKLVANLNRTGVSNTVVTQTDGVAMSAFLGQEFDRILLDAPCSSEGFSRKDSNFFEKMWSEKKIFVAAKLQRKLIESAFEMLRPEGIMLYSTCTSAPEENELVVQHLMDTYPDEVELLSFELPNIPSRPGITKFFDEKIDKEVAQKVHRIYPHLQTDVWNSESFFLSLIRKKMSIQKAPPKKPIIREAPQVYKKNKQAEILTRFAKRFGIEKIALKQSEAGERNVFVEKNNEIYVTTREAAAFCHKNLFRRFGMKVLDKDQNITTQFAMKYGKFATKNTINLTTEQKDRWLAGFDIFFPEDFESGFEEKNDEVFVKYEDFCLGYGKWQGQVNKLKNKLDRDLIIK